MKRFAFAFFLLCFADSAIALDIQNPLLIGRWVQYTYKKPNGTPKEYLALELQKNEAFISLVCQYADGSELEASTKVPIEIYEGHRGHEFFNVLADVHAIETQNGNLCELEFPKTAVYYIPGNGNLRILIRKYDRIMDMMLRQ